MCSAAVSVTHDVMTMHHADWSEHKGNARDGTSSLLPPSTSLPSRLIWIDG